MCATNDIRAFRCAQKKEEECVCAGKKKRVGFCVRVRKRRSLVLNFVCACNSEREIKFGNVYAVMNC